MVVSSVVSGLLGGLFCGDLVADRGVDVKGSDLWFGLDKVSQGIVDLLILFALILLSILLFVPKAQSQNAIGVGVRDQHNLVDEAALLFQNRHGFLIDDVGKLLRFP